MMWSRALALSVGLALCWFGVVSMRRTARRGSPLAALCLVAERLVRGCPPLRRADRDARVAGDAAAAPECAPARWSGASADLAHAGARMAGLRLLLGLGGLAATAASMLLLPAALLLCAPLPGVGVMLPGLLLERQADAARRASEQELPLLLELLAFRLRAGADLATAISACAPSTTGALRRALDRASWLTTCGTSPAAALCDAATELNLQPLLRVAVLLRRTQALGQPLSEPLQAVAAELGDAVLVAARRRAARSAPVATLLTALVVAPPCMAAMGFCVIGGALTSAPLPH